MILLVAFVLAQTRIASDFELQQMQRQVERARDFTSQLSGHLNIGDLRDARNEPDLAELPAEVKRDMRFVPVRTLEEVLRVALPETQTA